MTKICLILLFISTLQLTSCKTRSESITNTVENEQNFEMASTQALILSIPVSEVADLIKPSISTYVRILMTISCGDSTYQSKSKIRDISKKSEQDFLLTLPQLIYSSLIDEGCSDQARPLEISKLQILSSTKKPVIDNLAGGSELEIPASNVSEDLLSESITFTDLYSKRELGYFNTTNDAQPERSIQINYKINTWMKS